MVDCKGYHSRLAELVAATKGENYAATMPWIRAKVSFVLMRSALLCLRGSRGSRREKLELSDADLDTQKELANSHQYIENAILFFFGRICCLRKYFFQNRNGLYLIVCFFLIELYLN